MNKIKATLKLAFFALGIAAFATNALSANIETTCERMVLENGQSTNLVEGVYTAVATNVPGGAVCVNAGGTLTGTNVLFTGNVTTQNGGAIYNKGLVSLKDTTFTGNKASVYGGAIYNYYTSMLTLDNVLFAGNVAEEDGDDGAIYNGGKLNLDGAVTLKTETDMIHNGGMLNWSLVGGKQGVLNGYDKLVNGKTAKLQLTVEDCAPTNIVIATGDFTDVKGKKTFSITNVAGGAALEVYINSDVVIAKDGNAAYQLATVEAGETTNLVFSVLPKVTVDLKQDHATAYTNGAPVAGPFQAFSNDFVEVSYEAEEGYYFANGSTKMEGIMFRAKAEPATGPTGLDVNAYEPHVCDGVTFTKRITDTASLKALFEDNGNGYLATNVTLTEGVVQSDYTENNLCLNGYVLNANGEQIEIYGTLAIYDCGTTTNYFKYTENGLWQLTDKANADTNLVGGVFTGGKDYAPLYVGVYGFYPAPNEPIHELAINGGNFVGNDASSNCGGVIYGYYANVVIDGGTFAGNRSKKNGGVGYFYGGTNTINGGTFAGNTAEYGGVFCLEAYDEDESLLVISGGTFEGNAAEYGGVYYSSGSGTSLTVGGDAMFVGNKAAEGNDDASGTVFFNNGTMLLQGDVVISNNVGRWGTIYNLGTLTVTGDVQVVDNVATDNGGAIYSRWCDEDYPGECHIFGGTFANNGNYSAFVCDSWCWFELGGSPVIKGNGNAYGENDLRAFSYGSEWISPFWLSSDVPYNPPAGQKLTISADAIDNYDGNFVTVLENATKDDLNLFEPANDGYVLKYKWDEDRECGVLYLERPYDLSIDNTKYVDEDGRVIGTVMATTNGAPIWAENVENPYAMIFSGTEIEFTFTPTYTNDARYVLLNALTNLEYWIEGPLSGTTKETFAMPAEDVDVTAEFAWQTEYTKVVTVASNMTWEVFAYETYAKMLDVQNGGFAYGEGATFENGSKSGIQIYTDGRVALTNVTFRSNKQQYSSGAGAFNYGTMLLVGCTFETNYARYYGGGILNTTNLLTLVDCSFTNNSAQIGGALYNKTGADVVLRGTNTFATAKDTVFNGGTMTWDFTGGSTSYVETHANITNEGTFKIAFDATLANGFYDILCVHLGADLQGNQDFVITDGTESRTLEYEWVAIGGKRIRLGKTVSMTKGVYHIEVEGATEVPLFFSQAEGGSFVVYTNDNPKCLIDSGTMLYPGMQIVAMATPTNEYWAFDGEHLKIVDVNGVTYGTDYFVTRPKDCKFPMVDASATLYASFTASESCRNALSNRVSEVEFTTAYGIGNVKRLSDNERKMFNAVNHLVATNGEASLYSPDLRSPTAVSNQFDSVTNELRGVLRFVKAYAEAKPYDVMIATDFSGFPDYNKETGKFTYGGVTYQVGKNAFASFTAAYADEDVMPYATNVHVYGYQTIAQTPVAPKDGSKWNLDLVEDAVVTVWATSYSDLVNITNKLGQITGAGVILLGKTEDKVAPSIYDDFIAKGAKIVVKNTCKEWYETKGGFSVVVTDDNKVDDETGAVLVGGIETASKTISLSLDEEATNDVLVAGNLVATNEVKISNESKNALTVAGDVFGKNITIKTTYDAPIFMQEVTASGDVTINNTGHLEADVTAAGKISIVNGAPYTLVGTYEGAAISLTGGNAALSNATFATTGTVTIAGDNILTGPFAIEADEIENDGSFIWDIRGGNHAAYLADYDATFNYKKWSGECKDTIQIDEDQAVGTYVLAGNVGLLGGCEVVFKLADKTLCGSINVGNGSLIYGDRAYSLALGEDKTLSLSVADTAGIGVSWTASKGGTFEAFTNGVKIASGTKVLPGTKVTLKPTAYAGYVFNRTDNFTVEDTTGKIYVQTEIRDQEYYFTMPASTVTITPNFVKKIGCTVNGEDLALGFGDVWQLNYVTTGQPCIEIVEGVTTNVVLSGKVPDNRQVYVRTSSSTLADIILENVTIDVSAIEGCPAFVIECWKGEQRTLILKGNNYLASGYGQSAIKVRCADDAFVTIAGDGTLTAIPGKADGILPAIVQYNWGWEETYGVCQIIGGTFNAEVDPSLVPTKVSTDEGTKYYVSYSNGDTWTALEGGYVNFVSENMPYWYQIIAIGECVFEPVPPAKAGNVFKGWATQKGSALGDYWNFEKPLEASDLESAPYNCMQLVADFAEIDENTTNSTVVTEDGTLVVVDSFEKAQEFSPIGGTIIVSNENVNAKVDQPMIIVAAKDATVDVVPVPGTGLSTAKSGDDVTLVGQEVAGKVVVEKESAAEVIDAYMPAEVKWTVMSVSSPNVTDLLSPTTLAKAAALAKDCDAAVAGVNLVVEPTAAIRDDDNEIIGFTVDIKPVLTVDGYQGGSVTNLAQETNFVTAASQPITLSLYLTGFGKEPMLIKHTCENGRTEYFYNSLLAIKGEKTFSYDAVTGELWFETDSFSPFTISFVDEEQVEVTLDANGGYFGSPDVMTNTVWELSGVEGGIYRQLVTPINDPQLFVGWYYGTTRVQNGDAFATNGAHTLVAKWMSIEPVETNEYTVTFNVQGHGKAPLPQIVKEGECAEKPADPVEEGWEFGGWFKDKVCSNAYDFATKVTKDLTLYAKWTEEPQPGPEVETSVTFIESDYEVTEGDTVEVEVFGGSSERSTSVTLSFVKGTYTSVPTVYVDGEKAKFPLTLDWAKGEVCTQTVEIVTRKYSKVEADKFFTLQLSAPAGIELGAKPVATVTVLDKVQPSPEGADYVRALAWPANGGTVSGSGTLKNEKSKLTLKASAKSYATFAGWYLPMTNDVNQIDTNALVTLERSLKVGYGTEYGEGTYYAYFTDVLPVAAVVDPDASSEEAEGVVEEDGVYSFQVGIYAQLPLDIEDESGKGTLSVSSLPMGLKYDKKTGFIYGTPVKECVKEVKVVAKNAAGKQTVYYTFEVEAMPSNAIGTWNGLVRSLANTNDLSCAGIGSVQFSASSSGKLSAKVTTRLAGMKSFSTTGYELIDENTLGVTMTTRAGEVFEAKLILTNGWTEAQLFGKVTGGAFEKNDEECRFMAIKNAFDKKTGEAEAIALLKLFKGTYEDTIYLAKGGDEVGAITFKVQDGGKVQVKAKSENGVYSANCAGAFRIVTIGDEEVAMVQGAIRSGRRLLTFSTTIKADSDDIKGFACDYDTKGDDTHETIGVPTNAELID